MSTTVVEREVTTTTTSGAGVPPSATVSEETVVVRRRKKSWRFKRTMKKYTRKVRHFGRTATSKVKSAGRSTVRFTKRQARKTKDLAKRAWAKITVMSRKAGGYVKSVAKRAWVYAVKGAKTARAWSVRGLGYLGNVFGIAGRWMLNVMTWAFSFLMGLDVFFWVLTIGGFIFATAYWDDYVVGTSKWMRMKHRPSYTKYLARRRKIRKAHERARYERREQRRLARKAAKTAQKSTSVEGEPVTDQPEPRVSMPGVKMLQELLNHGISVHWKAKPEEDTIEVDPDLKVVDPQAAKQVKLGTYIIDSSDLVNLREILKASTHVDDPVVAKYFIGRLEALELLKDRPEDDPKKAWGLINRRSHRGQTDLGEVREGVRDMVTEFHESPYYRHLHAVPDLPENGEEEVTETPTKTAEPTAKRTPAKKAPAKAASKSASKRTPGPASARG